VMQNRETSQILRAWIVVIAWMGAIWIASGTEFSAANTSRIIGPLLHWLFPNIPSATEQTIHFFIRKGSHVTEYGILALLAWHALRLLFTRPRFAPMALSLALVFAMACADETHQSQNSSRTGTIKDVLLDLSGGAAFLLIQGGVTTLFRRRSPWANGGRQAIEPEV